MNKMQQIVKFTTDKYLYAGSAVLDMYYGTSFANDIDIFLPYHPDAKNEFKLINEKKYFVVELDSNTYADIISGVFKVYKIINKKSPEYSLDLVYMNVSDPNISLEDFHKLLVKEFDIVICSLAWDGNKFYYPPDDLANLKEKTSIMRFNECRLPTETKNPRDDVDVYNRRLMIKFARFDKYQNRGFKLTHRLI